MIGTPLINHILNLQSCIEYIYTKILTSFTAFSNKHQYTHYNFFISSHYRSRCHASILLIY
uniref:Uncharacterized protein n=1 Tax=Ascaris lumbricoides TaxID=6252 RepID=A0A0M3I8S7_ASCLU